VRSLLPLPSRCTHPPLAFPSCPSTISGMREMKNILHGLKDLNIVGMDVVEVAPAYDSCVFSSSFFFFSPRVSTDAGFLRRVQGWRSHCHRRCEAHQRDACVFLLPFFLPSFRSSFFGASSSQADCNSFRQEQYQRGLCRRLLSCRRSCRLERPLLFPLPFCPLHHSAMHHGLCRVRERARDVGSRETARARKRSREEAQGNREEDENDLCENRKRSCP
jgi:hypothetical protein